MDGSLLIVATVIGLPALVSRWARRRGMSRAKAFWLPVAPLALSTAGFWVANTLAPDTRHLFPAWFLCLCLLIPMAIACAVTVRVVRVAPGEPAAARHDDDTKNEADGPA